MQSAEHKQHITQNRSYSHCPECRADSSRLFAYTKPFRYAHVHEYLSWVRPRIEAIRAGAIEQEQEQEEYNALWWHRDFVRALHNRISSHLPGQSGRKHAPEYAKYHLATYGDDYRYLHNL